jgi:YidC/Oxa1 family membrane protein insertase
MDEKRILLAFVLTYLLIVAVRYWSPPAPPKPSPAPGGVAAPATSGAAQPKPAPAARAAAAESTAPFAPAASAPAAPAVADAVEKRIEVHTPVFSLAFTNRGARLLSWELVNYRNSRGQPEEMTPGLKDAPKPLDIETGDLELDRRLREGLFVASSDDVKVDPGGAAELSFRFSDGDLAATKTLSFQAGYLVSVAASVERSGHEIGKKIVWGPGLSAQSEAEKAVQGYTPPAAVFLSGNTLEKLPGAKIAGPRVLGPVVFAGVESHYFAALFMPADSGASAAVRVFSSPGPDGKPNLSPVAELDLGTATAAARLYVGPKDHTLLARIDPSLAKVVDVGSWIGPIVVPMIALLKWLYGWIGNYGWAIVLLTVGINLVMGPLRHMSIANGVKMAKLSPEMRVIQERYRKVPALDPKRQDMHKEIQALYGRHGMSMSSQMTVGCLPLLITMPFLFAIYRVLQVSIELRGAHFLWIPDLSQKDPYFIIPVLMGLSMFLMQRMMPSAMDPAQQRIMMLMPLMFTVMFFAAPAGMNLYWLTSNVCSIIQQSITLKLVGGRAALVQARSGKGAAR